MAANDNGYQQRWWENASIYQVYPLTFKATREDHGYGTLQGILEGMDYIASLGVDAIWFSPFFQGPLKKGFGYNISDYGQIEPLLGTNEEATAIIKAAHDKGMKVIFDMVFNHTSDEHPWFQASRDPNHPDHEKYKDYYVWADALPDGSPPNNWITVISKPESPESIWTWDETRRQYYLHNFADNMPDLNLHNPALREDLKDVMRYWLEQGVDGFRLDAIHFYTHNQDLNANACEEEPYEHVRCLPTTTEVLKEFRQAAQAVNPGVFILGEVFGFPTSTEYAAQLVKDGAIDAAYDGTLEASKGEFVAGTLNQRIQRTINMALSVTGKEAHLGVNWALQNHDMPRHDKRWNIEDPRALRLTAVLALCLPGSHCIFQGQELGLPAPDISEAKNIHRPEDTLFLSRFLGNQEDCRTMMPFTADQASNGWMPLMEEHRPLAISEQDKDPDSMLNFYRDLIRLKKQLPALQGSDITFLDNCDDANIATDLPKGVIGFQRKSGDNTLLCLFNTTDKEVQFALPPGLMFVTNQQKVVLEPYGIHIEDQLAHEHFVNENAAARKSKENDLADVG